MEIQKPTQNFACLRLVVILHCFTPHRVFKLEFCWTTIEKQILIHHILYTKQTHDIVLTAQISKFVLKHFTTTKTVFLLENNRSFNSNVVYISDVFVSVTYFRDISYGTKDASIPKGSLYKLFCIFNSYDYNRILKYRENIMNFNPFQSNYGQLTCDIFLNIWSNSMGQKFFKCTASSVLPYKLVISQMFSYTKSELFCQILKFTGSNAMLLRRFLTH